MKYKEFQIKKVEIIRDNNLHFLLEFTPFAKLHFMIVRVFLWYKNSLSNINNGLICINFYCVLCIYPLVRLRLRANLYLYKKLHDVENTRHQKCLPKTDILKL